MVVGLIEWADAGRFGMGDGGLDEAAYKVRMEAAGVPEVQREFYWKWLTGYWRFCEVRGVCGLEQI